MPVNLLTSPRYQAGDLGLPMPDDAHAVSACLPLWQHNIGYEEGDPAVIDRLKAAYPRFCFHPLIRELSDRFLNSADRRGLPFVSRRAAERAIQYVEHAGADDVHLQPLDGQMVCGVTVPAEHFALLKQYWQHAGENVSSRAAQQVLTGQPVTCTESDERQIVRRRVAEYQQTTADQVRLFPCGMAAVAAVWRAICSGWNSTTCQFGFPYVDTLKIQQRFPGAKHHFLPLGNAADLRQLEQLCQSSPPAAVFCEVPTNPLLITPDLDALRAMADRFGFLLVVDDTLAACGNLNVLPLADVVVTSLTKYFSGYGNVLAGAVTVNPASRHSQKLLELLAADFEETLSDIDTTVLAGNSEDVHERVRTINDNAAQLAEFLKQCPEVESVFYPTPDDPSYERLKVAGRGYGGLLSVVLRNAAELTPAVFDALRICKGPNLGTNFTLCCPYTILAHYTELEFAERCGVSRYLLRISVGTENADDLVSRFREALEAAV
ncbi:MAG: PLP-dependent transferase [Planctomycetaceae bacterium]